MMCCLPGSNPFRQISMGAFCAQFMASNPAVLLNKRKRFASFLRRTADGTLFTRPNIVPEWVAHLHYAPPMFGVLQSSYDDVEAELNEMRSRNGHLKILFVGGDGLSILRINHLLRNHPDLYLESTPIVVPVQGEAPHGVYHVMHGGWRLYIRFIRACVRAPNVGGVGGQQDKATKDDPSVKDFNTHIYLLWKLTRAAGEYLLVLSNTPGAIDFDQTSEFIEAAEENIDLAWLVHFLYDFAYLVLEFKQDVRGCESQHLDLLWTEYFATAHTGTANKIHYTTMAVMRVWWAQAMTPQLASLYHKIRSLPMSNNKGVKVGWDTPIEWLNGAITAGVEKLVSESRIENFIERFPLLQHNYNVLRAEFFSRAEHHSWMKSMETDVNHWKAFFIEKIGRNWQQATSRNTTSKLGITRGTPPWEEVRTTMHKHGRDSVAHYVAEHARNLTSNFYNWAP